MGEGREKTPEQLLLWPSPPDHPRIQWLREVRDLKGAGIEKGFWGRFRELLFGAQELVILRPYGVWANERENLAIVDTGAAMVHLFRPADGIYRAIRGSRELPLRSPVGITSNDEGELFITDSALGMVMRYRPADDSLQPLPGVRLQRPTGIVFNRRNRLLYVTDTSAHQVVVVDQTGRERFRFGGRGTGPAEFNFPTDLAIGPQGDLLVTDAMNGCIKVFSAEGGYLRTIGEPGDDSGRFAKPKGVAVDSDGHIYVADAQSDMVKVFDQNGGFLLSFGENGNGPGQFWMPSGVYLGRDDLLYVADTYNQRIQIFRYLKNGENE
jgi:DNA-binding beta-propeller fold protein YncE